MKTFSTTSASIFKLSKKFSVGVLIFSTLLGTLYQEVPNETKQELSPLGLIHLKCRNGYKSFLDYAEKGVGSIPGSNIISSTQFDKNGGFEARTLSEEVRTVLLNGEGEAVILTLEEVKRGKRLFNVACGSCHVGGLTKTNPNVGLDIASLNSAVPPRNNISSLVDFLNSPKSYDGFQSISEIHPGIESCDLFPKMRTLTREDLVAVSGHILLQTKILNERWGGGKIYY